MCFSPSSAYNGARIVSIHAVGQAKGRQPEEKERKENKNISLSFSLCFSPSRFMQFVRSELCISWCDLPYDNAIRLDYVLTCVGRKRGQWSVSSSFSHYISDEDTIQGWNIFSLTQALAHSSIALSQAHTEHTTIRNKRTPHLSLCLHPSPVPQPKRNTHTPRGVTWKKTHTPSRLIALT